MATKTDQLYEALYSAGSDPVKFLKALGPLLVAVFPAGSSATPEPKPSELASMGIRPAGSNADQALVNARLGYSADASRRLWKPEDMPARIRTYEKNAAKFAAIGVPADTAEYGVLTGIWPEFGAVESFNDYSGYLTNFVGLSLHDKLLADLTETGHASGGEKK